ncbi:MAG: hypothetical protein ACFCU7_14730 [Pleurocapsa sp.]
MNVYKSLPVIIGITLVFVVPASIGGFVYSLLSNETAEKQTENPADSNLENNPFEDLPKEENIIAPAPPTNSNSASGIDLDSNQGIATGRYSNPPTTVKSFGDSGVSDASLPPEIVSSVERNRLIQQNIDKSIADYSTPSSSNNFNRPEENSLIDPLEDDSFLEIPDSSNEEAATTSPVSEPLLQPATIGE